MHGQSTRTNRCISLEACHSNKALGSINAWEETRSSYPEMHELLMQINRCMSTDKGLLSMSAWTIAVDQ
eukprot:1151687-Pelagomonas_calceolata.AAC.1